ncbi:MAG: FlgD immunoglobulin-like domain containing protein [Bacteroidota bacterium]|nr:FlgD immunoglobulin-like domain containing protein [Bacteroidota bacterium]
MKLIQRFLLGISAVAFALIIGVTTSKAQTAIWAAYDCEITNQFYNPLAVAQVIPDAGFDNFTNAIDRDDGVAVDIPTFFSFDFNGTTYSTVNVCVNGWISLGTAEGHPIPTITNDKYFLFLPNRPNATLAPFWGDHYYRTFSDAAQGFKPSKIQYTTVVVPDPNPNAPAGSFLHTFIVEWKDLNINDKTNPNSIATFQVKLIENPLANDIVPDHRVYIEFHYGPIGASGNVKTQGCTVGIEDAQGLSHMNALFQSSFSNGDPIRLNTDSLTTCWPPASCLPGRVITFTPVGRGTLAQWGDGDADLTQLDPLAPANVRLNQNLFVTINDADTILRSVATSLPALDSNEGRQAFHGDANHNGRYTNPNFPGFFFYKVTSYDAAYILMYLAAKLPFLPWPQPLPVPSWKETSSDNTSISGVTADVKSMKLNGNTALVPIVLHGTVNGPLGLEMNVASLNPTAMQFVGTEADPKVMMRGNAMTGKVVLAASGVFADGDVLGYLEFNVGSRVACDFELSNVSINDQPYSSSRSTLSVAGAGNTTVKGFAVEQNMPNPFVITNSGVTTIHFSIAESQNVSVRIFDMLGKEVRSLVSGETFAAGENQINWDGRDNTGSLVASGAYYYQVTAGENMQTVKMQVAR